jgi:uncharacterized protein (TIGR03437 family)
MKRVILRLSIALDAVLSVLVFLLAEGSAPPVPFVATPILNAFDYSSGVTLLVRAPDLTYTQLVFNATGSHGLLSSLDSLMKIISGGVSGSPTASGPPNVGLASQMIAVANFTGDNSPGVAYVDPAGDLTSVAVYLGTPSFLYRGSATYAVGTNAAQVLAADFNHDGKADLAVTAVSGLAILLNKGDGTFGPATTYPDGIAPTGAAAYDLNHDGNLHLVVTDAGSNPGKVYVFLGKGDGTFAAGVTYTTDANPQSVTIADCNGDGNPDLAVSTGTNTVAILLGSGSETFGAATSFPTGLQPLFIAAGDLNGDGKIDLVTANAKEQTVTVLLGSGNGSFTAAASYATSYFPTSLVLTDYNHDGKLDVIQGTGDARGIGAGYDSTQINILPGNGNGTLQGSRVFTGAGNSLSFLGTGDFNGDGKLDVVANDQSKGTLYLFAGSGKGVFQKAAAIAALTSSNPYPAPYAGASGDFNGDGKPDLAVSDSGDGGITILLNSASGLKPSTRLASGGAAAGGIVTGDFNGDGKLDLAVTTHPDPNFGTGNAKVAVFFGAGDGSFQMQKAYPAVAGPYTIVAADVDGDGNPDLVVADRGLRSNRTNGVILVYRNDGHGGFLAGKQYTVGAYPQEVAVADLNGDAKPDLAVTTGDLNYNFTLQVLLNNGDGTFQAPKTVSSDVGVGPLIARDFNGDGKGDIVATAAGDTNLIWFQGNGDGSFMTDAPFAAGFTPASAVVADLNGDGQSDLLVGCGNGTLAALLNNATSAATTVNWATSALQVAPNSIASIYGTHLATGTASTGVPLALTLAGTSATITDSGGTAQPAGLYYASPTQINLVIPPGLTSGTAAVAVKAGDGVVSNGTVTVSSISPGILTANGFLNAYVVHYDAQGNTSAPIQTVQADAGGNIVATPISLDPASDKVFLLIFGTGIRGAPTSQVTVQIGSMTVTPSYSGPQGEYDGMDQINIQLPYSLKGAGDVTISLTAVGQKSNTGHITLQ